MIGYKATANGKCKRKTYKLGKTYTLKSEMKICKRGFHFCQDLFDVFEYYPPNKNTKVFKVEALGNVETEDNKSVTDKIKILEEVNLSNIIVEKYGYKKHFDDKGNCIKIEYPDVYWEKFKYDSKNRRIKEENSFGSWTKFKYDKNNNLIKQTYSDNSWIKWKYNEKNKCINIEYGKG
ncbi:hypothetical protein M0P65_05480 [Candidatus Gracilibacteria bacterium]|nr:hypothetical protein [Candidatus Gracilibacteria bacterium]